MLTALKRLLILFLPTFNGFNPLKTLKTNDTLTDRHRFKATNVHANNMHAHAVVHTRAVHAHAVQAHAMHVQVVDTHML